MPEPYAIPMEERAPELKEYLFAQANSIARIKSRNPQSIPESTISPFFYAVYPWIVAASNAEQEAIFAARRAEFEAAEFIGGAVRQGLIDILAHDKHLRECCVGIPQLAHCLDLGFIKTAASMIAANSSQEKLEEVYERFIATVYGQGRFKAISLCHLFNFQSDQPSLQFGDIRIERLDSTTISRVLGETSFASFIHPPGTGQYFIVSELDGPCDEEIKWLFEQKQKAELFTHVLQYFKDGVVHLDSAVPHFLPQWVNEIRKGGIFFVGTPRRLAYEAGQKFYTVTSEEVPKITCWWNAYQKPEIFQRINDLRHTLRQAGLRAAEYYEANHAQEKPEGRLISLAIALEALFSPNDKGEFTFRISQSLSQLVGATDPEREAIFQQAKKFYKRRSELVHGQYDVDAYLQGRFVTHEECDRWASPIRQAILRFLVFYLRGRNHRDDVLNELALASINPGKGESLREESNLQDFLNML
jgi:Apea-like HEPN